VEGMIPGSDSGSAELNQSSLNMSFAKSTSMLSPQMPGMNSSGFSLAQKMQSHFKNVLQPSLAKFTKEEETPKGSRSSSALSKGIAKGKASAASKAIIENFNGR
jgi:hypothetical protein